MQCLFEDMELGMLQGNAFGVAFHISVSAPRYFGLEKGKQSSYEFTGFVTDLTMLTFCDAGKKESTVKEERCLDAQLWHACAGGMVQMPAVGAKVFYFPQGHAEHAAAAVDFSAAGHPKPPAFVLCTVAGVKFMADADTDEVFAKIHLVPAAAVEEAADDGLAAGDAAEKPASFAKTLTQSDANNGGGFSVPRYCAETIFPRLDYTADPPVQTVLAKDVHGEVWKFRHIYRGTPRRHLLTTGWSTFVNQKKLVAGDSIVFLRAENGELCVGIRRAKRGIGGGGPESPPPSGWNPAGPYGCGFSMFVREEESKLGRNGGNCGRGKAARVRTECVVEAVNFAGNGRPFEVVYYPRASTPEFCVKASAVRASTRIQWCPGMRFKMAFETEDSSRISWFMGTISSVHAADPVRWPNSPWRALQVTWDEPDLLQNVKRVSPWLVELVSHIPAIHLTPFSPPRKKFRLPQLHDLPVEGQLSVPNFSGNRHPLGPSNPLCCLNSADNAPAGIQGARHTQFGLPLSDLHLNKLQSGMFPGGFRHVDLHHTAPTSRVPLLRPLNAVSENVSCLPTIGNSGHNTPKSEDVKTTQFILFGQPILTEQQLSLSNSLNSSSDGSADKTTNISSNGMVDNSSSEVLPCYKDQKNSYLGLETGHCKVFMESEDVGRTLDLSSLSSYEELYRKLANMFGIDNCESLNNVLYRDAKGAVKHTGDEPFSEFTKTAKRLTILMDSGSDNMVR